MNDVIEWLRSSEGEDWSRKRIESARRTSGEFNGADPVEYTSIVSWYGIHVRGFFSIKQD